jgi:hypothetical protein
LQTLSITFVANRRAGPDYKAAAQQVFPRLEGAVSTCRGAPL